MTVVADTAPLVAAINRRERAHALAVSLVRELGANLIVPITVAVEGEYLVKSRVDSGAARGFMASLAAGEHRVAYLSSELLRRAVEIDAQYADLDLGLVDASVMAIAERHDLPVLTFDFEHFRATRPAEGRWRLVVDEATFAAAIGAT